jgi:dihydrofolate reductase
MSKIVAGITTSVDGYITELTVIVAPVVLGGGKRLFEGFTQSIDLEHLWVRQSPFATFIHYRVMC